MRWFGYEVFSSVSMRRKESSPASALPRARVRWMQAEDRSVRLVEATDPLGHKPGEYAAIAAIGVIGAGAANLANRMAIGRVEGK